MPDTPAAPDQLAAKLADVRLQADDHGLVPAADVYPLLAALEAVWRRTAPEGVPVNGGEDWDWTLRPAAIREVITTELLGKAGR